MEKDKCLAVCVHGCCPIEDEDGGANHSHVCKLSEEHEERAAGQSRFHKCACGKEWTGVDALSK